MVDVSGIGAKTAERLDEVHGIETASELSVGFFGECGGGVSETLYSPSKVMGSLYRQTREVVANESFGVDRSRYRAIDVMVFIRVFGVGVEWLTSEFFTQHDVSSKYDIGPSDFVWSDGCVTNAKNTVGYAYWGIPWEYDEGLWGDVEAVSMESDGVVRFERAETTACVSLELLEGIEKITGREYVDGGACNVQIHRESDDMPVLIYDSEISGRFMIAPRVRW